MRKNLDEGEGLSKANTEASSEAENKLARKLDSAISLGLFTLLLSSPIVLGNYARLDDYVQLLWVMDYGKVHLIDWSLTFGRPVTFLVNSLTFETAGSISNLWVSRLVGAVSFSCSAVLMCNMVVAKSHTFLRRVVLVTLFVSLPGLWVFLSWAQGAGHGVSFLCAVFACYLTRLSCLKQAKSLCRGLLLSGSTFFFVFLAIFGYQPFGLAIPGIFLGLSALSRFDKPFFRPFYLTSLFVVVAMVVNALVVRSYPGSPRSRFASDLQQKFEWAMSEFLPRTAWPFSLTVKHVPAMIVAGCVLVAATHALLQLVRSGRQNTAVQLFIASIISLSFPLLPHLLIEENWASSRATLTPAFVFWILALATLFRVIDRWIREFSAAQKSNQVLRKFLGLEVVTVIGLLVLCFFSLFRAHAGLVAPSIREWNQTQSVWAAIDSPIAEIRICALPFFNPGVPYVSYDEYGILTGSVSWAAPSMHRIAAREAKVDSLNDPAVEFIKDVEKCRGLPWFSRPDSGNTATINSTLLWK